MPAMQPAPGPPIPASPDGTTANTATMTPMRVMVVEDDPMIGMYLSEVLVGMGHSVCALETTEAGAIAAAKRWHPEMMIVDGRLHEGSGVAAVREILRHGFVPHVFVSGDRLVDQVLTPGAVVIQKPFYEPDLVRGMKAALAAVAAKGPKLA